MHTLRDCLVHYIIRHPCVTPLYLNCSFTLPKRDDIVPERRRILREAFPLKVIWAVIHLPSSLALFHHCATAGAAFRCPIVALLSFYLQMKCLIAPIELHENAQVHLKPICSFSGKSD